MVTNVNPKLTFARCCVTDNNDKDFWLNVTCLLVLDCYTTIKHDRNKFDTVFKVPDSREYFMKTSSQCYYPAITICGHSDHCSTNLHSLVFVLTVLKVKVFLKETECSLSEF